MRDSVSLGPVPCDEECQQVDTPTYDPIRARKECVAYRNQLRRVFGQEPFGASLRITSNPHDFGNYHEVECFFDDTVTEAAEYAYRCEDDSPSTWDDEARRELGLA